MTTEPEPAEDQTPVPPPASLVAPAAYNTLVASARLKEIRLVHSEFNLDPEGMEQKPSWKQTHSCAIQETHYDPEDGLLVASVVAEAACMIRGKKVLSAKCKYLIAYDIDGKPLDDVIGAFARRVARFAAYPYFRSHFAELASQAGIFLPPLPIIKEKKLLPTEAKVREHVAGESAEIADSDEPKSIEHKSDP